MSCTKLLLILTGIFAIFVGIVVHSLRQIPEVPNLEDTWWGPGEPKHEDAAIKPFKINIPEDILTDLSARLKQARPFVPPLEDVQQEYGMNTKLLGEIVEFWKTKYNWREREKFLNQFPQFTTMIQGLKIHYIHVKPKVPSGTKIVPLLLLHGWPGSVREFYEMIPLLTTPQKDRDFVFEVIVPSLPGYGFSQGASRPGLGAYQMAVVFKNLMKRIGFEKYYIQGGDWGAVIVTTMGSLFPEHILGVHSNACIAHTPIAHLKHLFGIFFPRMVVEEKHQHKMYPYGKIFTDFVLEMGYMHLQATKPDTIGVALTDSPVGLAAYILEKFTTWTNPEWKKLPDGGLKKKYTYTKLLDNVMIYWTTKSITTSMRLYAETLTKAQMASEIDKLPVHVPTACARFEYEIIYHSDFLLKEKYWNLVQVTDFSDGGHFAAFEEPKLLAEDVWNAVSKFIALKA